MQVSRVLYVILALFLGTFGIHNFIAGYNAKGWVQVLVTIGSFGFLAPLIFIWNVIEIITVKEDSDGVPFS